MTFVIFLFNIVQLLMIIGMFYYALFYRLKKKKSEPGTNNNDDGGLLVDLWPNVVLPPIDGIEYPSQQRPKHQTT